MKGLILALLLIVAATENASAEADFHARLAPDVNLTIIGMMGEPNLTITLFGVWHEYFQVHPGSTKIFVTDLEGNIFVSSGKVTPI